METQQRTRIEVLAAIAALAVGVSACGGSSKSSTSKSGTATAASGSSSSSASGSASASSSSSAGSSSNGSSSSSASSSASTKFHAVLTGENHSPIATKPWHYTVRVTSLSGRPLAGTVDTEFAFDGQVVGREVPPTHPLKNGELADHVEFPQQAVGQPLELQVVVHTSAGSQTLDWPVSVKP